MRSAMAFSYGVRLYAFVLCVCQQHDADREDFVLRCDAAAAVVAADDGSDGFDADAAALSFAGEIGTVPVCARLDLEGVGEGDEKGIVAPAGAVDGNAALRGDLMGTGLDGILCEIGKEDGEIGGGNAGIPRHVDLNIGLYAILFHFGSKIGQHGIDGCVVAEDERFVDAGAASCLRDIGAELVPLSGICHHFDGGEEVSHVVADAPRVFNAVAQILHLDGLQLEAIVLAPEGKLLGLIADEADDQPVDEQGAKINGRDGDEVIEVHQLADRWFAALIEHIHPDEIEGRRNEEKIAPERAVLRFLQRILLLQDGGKAISMLLHGFT